MRTDPATVWMAQGACVGENPDLFFEAAGEAQAKSICQACTVRHECLGYARAERIDWGVWGGMNAAERTGRGRPRLPIIHGTYNGYRTHLRRNEKVCDECARANADYAEAQKQQKFGTRRYTKCAHPFGCDQWAMRGHQLCWTHLGRPKTDTFGGHPDPVETGRTEA